MSKVPRSPHDVLPRLFQAGVAAVAPGPAVRRTLDTLDLPRHSWTRILALGKAAVPMAVAATEALRQRGLRVRDGLIVPATSATLADPALRVVPGDHPVPGKRSAAAAAAIARFTADGRRPDDLALVLLSGGTSSLVADPVDGLTRDELRTLYHHLQHAGLAVGEMNRVRRRFARWAGGRLGVALAPAQRVVLAISDVPGDHFPDIGSGPCSPDPDTAGSLLAWLKSAGLADQMPRAALRVLDETTAGQRPETPQPGDERLSGITTRIIATNADAVKGVLDAASRLGLRAEPVSPPLSGDAAAAGVRIANELLAMPTGTGPDCLVWGGETSVNLPEGCRGTGGRSQELALAAAEVLVRSTGDLPALLAAGTDGIDGATDAAGALVTPATWPRIVVAGRDPQRDLARHDSHPALAASGALVRTGPTGTNVMDLVIALRR